jgi:hypothetical protein
VGVVFFAPSPICFFFWVHTCDTLFGFLVWEYPLRLNKFLGQRAISKTKKSRVMEQLWLSWFDKRNLPEEGLFGSEENAEKNSQQHCISQNIFFFLEARIADFFLCVFIAVTSFCRFGQAQSRAQTICVGGKKEFPRKPGGF